MEERQFEISLLDSPYIEYYWPFIEREMDRIPETWKDRITKDALYDAVMGRHFQVWVVGPKNEIRMVVVTRVVRFPETSALRVEWTFGTHLDEVLPIIDATLELYAAHLGCRWIEITGRKGWEKKMKSWGFEFDSVLIRRNVKVELH